MKRLMDLVARMSYILMQGTLEKDISSVTYDSRKVEPGCVFVAWWGPSPTATSISPDVVAKGAAAVVVERDVEVPSNVTILKVSNSRLALAELAAAWFDHPAEAADHHRHHRHQRARLPPPI